jgi:alpha-1,6-mannosyltransferase
VKITPEWRVHILGITLCVALTICSRNFGDRGGPYFMASLALAGIAYLLAVREFFATPRFPRRVVVLGLFLAAVWHIEFLRVPAGADDDVHRYVWDGRLQRLGYNPYIVVPSDPAVRGLHTPETRTLNNPDLPSPYPPGAELFFRAVTAIQESTFALKAAFVVCEFAIIFLLLDVLRLNQRGAHLVLGFAWNPLLAIEVAGSGHVDIVGAFFLVVSAAALVRRWRATAAIGFGLAVAVKFLPVVLLPLYWKRVRIRDAVLAAVVVGLLYVPFLDHGRVPIGSLGTYVQTFRFNGPVFAALDRVAAPQLLVGLAVLVGFATATLRIAAPDWSPKFLSGSRQKVLSDTYRSHASQATLTTEDTEFHRGDATVLPICNSVSPPVQASAFAWPMAATLLCAPAVFPWYLLWLLPFLTSASTLLIIVWTVSIMLTYVQWHLRALGRPWGPLPGWVMLMEYGCVAAVGAMIALRRLMRAASPQ